MWELTLLFLIAAVLTIEKCSISHKMGLFSIITKSSQVLRIHSVPVSVFSQYISEREGKLYHKISLSSHYAFFCVFHEVYLCMFLLHNVILKQFEVANIKGSAGLSLERIVILNSELQLFILYPSTF